jgi:3-oxoacyl-[acyl-carrier-protein] synthase III
MTGILRAAIKGTGSALPRTAVSNDALAIMKGIDTSDEWIIARTGIKQRYLAEADETTATLATAAAKAALADAGLTGKDIDLIVLATATPDQTFPAVATIVQNEIGANGGIAFDVAAVCSGFLYALTVAESMIRAGTARNALVIGAETFSRLMDWEDRGTCVLFGDGAGAVVLSGETGDAGVLSTAIHADGAHNQLLYVDGGVSTTGTVGCLRMTGKEVFRHAVTNLASCMVEAMEKADMTAADIDWLVPHQANARILDATAKKLGFAKDKVVITVDQHANTSAASVPLALDVARKDGRIKTGDLVVLEAMGGGFTWGAAVVRM